MTLRTGVDLIEIERIERVIAQHGQRFLRRVYTPQELQEVGGSAASLAARFAAKEAAAKALGTGLGQVCWTEIEVLRGPAREPRLCLHGEAKRLADELGLNEWSVSLSHSREYAVAFVVAMGGI
jgi:holo-[acyl-carrier protein] synthase